MSPHPVTDLAARAEAFYTNGWVKLDYDPHIAAWLQHAGPLAKTLVADPQNAHWLRCGETWFVGVNILPNDRHGAVGDSNAMGGTVADLLTHLSLPCDLFDQAQISVTYPGYPKPHPGETEAATRFRRDRDAAHVDGLLPVGPKRQRMLREPHAFVLGIPITQTDPGASPMVVWEGSHRVIRSALKAQLNQIPPKDWPGTDLTQAYTNARRAVFQTCARKIVHANPGETYLMHRLAVHGVAPWDTGAKAPPEGRMIAYFRPELTGPITQWLDLP